MEITRWVTDAVHAKLRFPVGIVPMSWELQAFVPLNVEMVTLKELKLVTLPLPQLDVPTCALSIKDMSVLLILEHSLPAVPLNVEMDTQSELKLVTTETKTIPVTDVPTDVPGSQVGLASPQMFLPFAHQSAVTERLSELKLVTMITK